MGDAGCGVLGKSLVVGEGEEALAGEHGGAEVDCCGLEEEEGLEFWLVFVDLSGMVYLHARI